MWGKIRSMDAETLAQILAPLPLGPVRYFDRTGSTNTEAARWAEAGAPDLALVVADEQTAGRGRFKRRWLTPPGAALALSLVIRPWTTDDGRRMDGGEQVFSRLTGLGAVAVCAALKAKWGLPARIKWPNDVLVDGRKLAGILVEAHWQGAALTAAILGIGLNVAASAVPPPEVLKYPATSVADCLEQRGLPDPASRLNLLAEVLKHLVAWRARLDSEDFLRAWEEALAFRGEWVSVDQSFQAATGGSQSIPLRVGQILGLAWDGALRLRDRSGEEFTVQAGELAAWPGFSTK